MTPLQTYIHTYAIAWMLLAVLNAVWGYRDARQRGYSGVLIAFLVISSFPIGVILWLALRPELLPEQPPDDGSGDADADLKKRANAGLL